MHKAWSLTKNIVIVISVRNVEDIIKSQKRIRWRFENVEKKKYESIRGLNMDQPICKIKYDYAEMMKDERTLFVKRGLFSEHHLWLPKDDRNGFSDLQTKVRR